MATEALNVNFRRRPTSVPPHPTTATRTIVVIVKTNYGGMWLLPQTAALRDRGHRVVVILPPGPGRLTTRLAEQGITTVESPFSFRFRPDLATLRGLWRLRQVLRHLRPDVLNYHLYAATLAGRIASLGLRLSRVQTVVGPLFLESATIRRTERLLWRLDDAIICGTAYTSRLYGQLGVPEQRRPVVTCGIDLTWAMPELTTDDRLAARPARIARRAETRAKARAELGIDPDRFVVVMVAYVYPPRRLAHTGQAIKGHDVLLTAWQQFRTAHPNVHLLLVGGGANPVAEQHRQELIRRFGVADDPTVSWYDTVEDVRLHYQAADLSVSPSRSEGHGAPPQAGSLGVPSIVSDAGGLPETVDEHTGWVVPRDDPSALAEALVEAYGEFRSGLLTERGEYARELAVRLFDNRVSATRMAEIIESGPARRGVRDQG